MRSAVVTTATARQAFAARAALYACTLAGHAAAADLRVEFSPPAFDSFRYRDASGQPCSLTRFDFLLSEAALRAEDGRWLGQHEWCAFLCLRETRDGFTLRGLPPGRYSAVRFLVGLRPEVNHADVAQYPPQHPLHPTLNTLHWGWQGGFVFLALEGGWRRADGSVGGFSFHLANDENLTAVELPVDLDLRQDLALSIDFDPARILGSLPLDDQHGSTHSRAGDPLAARLRDSVGKAWSVRSARAVVTTDAVAEATPAPRDPVAAQTPLPFTVAAHFPRPPLPGDNPLSVEMVALGKSLFHDRRLSGNGTQSCADCHPADHGFADPRALSVGATGLTGTRNAMPLFNLAWKQRFFWDGRAPSLREQVLQPIQDSREMNHRLPDLEHDLGMSSDQIARALEQYLLTLVSDDAKIDRVKRGEEQLSPEERRGFELFHTEYDPPRGQFGADCFHCHGGTLFQNVAFANNGLDSAPRDPGLGAVTGKPGDAGKFAVPSLRNVALTAPYMHDGRFATLEEVIAHYDHGVQRSPTLDPNLAKHPATGLHLSAADQHALVAFLHTLTGERLAKTNPPQETATAAK